MSKAFAGIFVLLSTVVLILFAVAELGDAAANQTRAEAGLAYARGQAEAMVVRAQAESRLTAATASAVTSAAMLPWGVLGVLGLLGLAIVALCATVVIRPPRHAAPQIIERQIILLPPPGPRRVTWQALSQLPAGQLHPSSFILHPSKEEVQS
jgi:hypothetical protein